MQATTTRAVELLPQLAQLLPPLLRRPRLLSATASRRASRRARRRLLLLLLRRPTATSGRRARKAREARRGEAAAQAPLRLHRRGTTTARASCRQPTPSQRCRWTTERSRRPRVPASLQLPIVFPLSRVQAAACSSALSVLAVAAVSSSPSSAMAVLVSSVPLLLAAALPLRVAMQLLSRISSPPAVLSLTTSSSHSHRSPSFPPSLAATFHLGRLCLHLVRAGPSASVALSSRG